VKLSSLSSPIAVLALLAIVAPIHAQELQRSVLINEIMFDPAGDDAGREWVELFNAGAQATDLKGWTLTNRSGEQPVTLPAWQLPPGSYLLVALGAGQNDADLSDGSGTYHVGRKDEFLHNSLDEVGLYRGAPAAETIVDFVAYALLVDYQPGTAHGHAVAAKRWAAGKAFDAAEFVAEGNSIGRTAKAHDNDSPFDWYGDGGVHADGPTPGAVNESELSYELGATTPIGALVPAVFGRLTRIQRAEFERELRAVIAQIRNPRTGHMDLITPNGDPGLGEAAPTVERRSGDIIVGNVRFQLRESLRHDDRGAGGLTHPPSRHGGQVRIELSWNAVTKKVTVGGREQRVFQRWKLKDIVLHELVHAALFNDRQSGMWRTDGRAQTGKTAKEVIQVHEAFGYLSDLRLLHRLWREFPNDRADIVARHRLKIKALIVFYLRHFYTDRGSTFESLDGFKGAQATQFGNHLRDLLYKARDLIIKEKIHSFLVFGGRIGEAENKELTREIAEFNRIKPDDKPALTNEQVRQWITEAENEAGQWRGERPAPERGAQGEQPDGNQAGRPRPPADGVAQPKPKPQPEDAAQPAISEEMAKLLREAHRKLKQYYNDAVKLAEEAKEWKRVGQIGEDQYQQTVDHAKKRFELLKQFEEENKDALKSLGRSLKSPEGLPDWLAQASLVDSPGMAFATNEGAQAYASIEYFSGQGDLAGLKSWNEQLGDAIALVSDDASSQQIVADLQIAADIGETVVATVDHIKADMVKLRTQFAATNGDAVQITNILDEPPAFQPLGLPDAFADTEPAGFTGRVFDRFGDVIATEVAMAGVPTAGEKVVKKGAVFNAETGGPNVGATVSLFAQQADPATDQPRIQTATAQTDENGGFKFEIPTHSPIATVRIGGPGLLERARRIRIDSPAVQIKSARLEQWNALPEDKRKKVAGFSNVARHWIGQRYGATDRDRPTSLTVARDEATRATAALLGQVSAPPGKDALDQYEAVYEEILAQAQRDADSYLAGVLRQAEEEVSAYYEAAAEEALQAANAYVQAVADGALEALSSQWHQEFQRLRQEDDFLKDLPSPQMSRWTSEDQGLVVPVERKPTQVVIGFQGIPNDQDLEQVQDQIERAVNSAADATGPIRVQLTDVAPRLAPGSVGSPPFVGGYVTVLHCYEVDPRDEVGRPVDVDKQRLKDELTTVKDQNSKVTLAQPAEPVNEQVDVPNDPHFSARGTWGEQYDDQWALKRIGMLPGKPDADAAMEKIADGRECVVAVIGSGVDWTHPELFGQMWVNIEEDPYNGKDDDGNGYVDDQFGWNFRDRNRDVMDYGGHDTHVAGVIAARWNNGKGIVGVNPHARIMALKVANYLGQANTIDVSLAIFYAVANGARVINISYGGETPTEVEKLAIEYAQQRGVLVVIAAGNQGADAATRSLASDRTALTVAGTTLDDRRAGFSNWGQPVDLSAPSMDVLSLRANQTDFLLYSGESTDYESGIGIVGKQQELYRASGTSFAAPFVSGAASLVLSLRPELQAQQVKNMLLMSADDLDVPGWDQHTGAGIVNVPSALSADPDQFLGARISKVAPVRRGGAIEIEVRGQVVGRSLSGRWLQIGFGENPARDAWTTIAHSREAVADDAPLGTIPASRFDRPGNWTIRILVQDEKKNLRQARATLKLQ